MGILSHGTNLLKMTSGSDGEDARNCVLAILLISPQGTFDYINNYEFDYVSFVKAVKRSQIQD